MYVEVGTAQLLYAVPSVRIFFLGQKLVSVF